MRHKPGVTCPAYVWVHLRWEQAEALRKVLDGSRGHAAAALRIVEREMKDAEERWKADERGGDD